MNLIVQNTKSIAGILAVIMMVLAVGFSFTAVDSYATQGGTAQKDDFWGDLTIGDDGNVNPGQGNESAFGTIIQKYQKIITFISGLATATMVAVFIFNFTKLGTTSTNPAERQKVITGLIFSGIAAALLGSVTFLVGVFLNFLK